MLLGWRANPQFGTFHLLSFAFIGSGFVLIAAAWRDLYAAQQQQVLATTGPYAHVRHPLYVGFVLVMLGFLFQWPTLLTLAMFPVLVWMYVHLARQERDVRARFGEVSSPVKNPALSGGTCGCCCGREQDGGQDQQKELPEPCQEEPEVVADGAEHGVDDASSTPLSGFRSRCPSCFMWPMTGSIPFRRRSSRRMPSTGRVT